MNEDRFKMRAWDKGNNQYEYQIQYDLSHYFTDDYRYIIEQCTGVRDMCGRLIYEGDVVEDINNSLLYVSYCDETGSLMLFDIEAKVPVFHIYDPSNNLKVIGNVHENVPKFWEDKQ